MKIDLLRKLPEHMDTVIVMLDAKADPTAVEYLPAHITAAIGAYVKAEGLAFDLSVIRSFQIMHADALTNVIICGVGEAAKLDTAILRKLMADCVRAAIKLNAQKIYLFPGFANPVGDVQLGHIIAEAAMLTEYRFTRYMSSDKHKSIEAVHIALNLKNTRHINRGIMEGRIFAEATNFARNLVNEPANVINPESLADAARKAALQYGFTIEVYNMDKLKRIKMEAFMAVGKGSKQEPRLIVMKYNGHPDAKAPLIGLVGKGLTYDSGGYCVKTPQGMVNMKDDMAGAAAVIGAFCAAATLKLKVNLVGVVAACENMISGEAYHTGDIIRSMAGKCIEVINTDAEGRLTLIDAIHYAISREHVDRVLDIATLTGAAVGALGNQISAVVTNDDAWLKQLQSASEFSGEKIWQLPAHDEYMELIKSNIADLKNTGGPYAGTITAALFIREFVENKPWLHIDIAGTALRDSESGIYPIGATGVGVRLITQLLREME